MTRQVDYHDWVVMTDGDNEYPNIFNVLIDDIDREALNVVKGLPSTHDEGRWFIRTSDKTVVYDDGTNFIEITPERRVPRRAVTWNDKPETIGATWTFEQSIDADITGNCEWADNADHANQAQNTDALGGFPAADYCLYNSNETITGAWTFVNKLRVNSLEITNETLALPRYG